MENPTQPTYRLKVKHFKRDDSQYPFIAFDPPYEWMSDISHIHHSHFETLIAELEAVLHGILSHSGAFGGERVSCIAQVDKTTCHDSHEDCYVYVDTAWMLKLIKEFYEFKKPYFGGYLPPEL